LVCSLIVLLLSAAHLYVLGIAGCIDGGTVLLYPFCLRAAAVVCAIGLLWGLITSGHRMRLPQLALLAALIGVFALYSRPTILYRLVSSGLRHQLQHVGGVDRLQRWAEDILTSSESSRVLLEKTTEGDLTALLDMLPQEYRRFFSQSATFHAVENDTGQIWIVSAKAGHPDYTYGLLIGRATSSPPSQYGYLVHLGDGVYVWHREF
jgi:hypothetical protein